MFSFPALDRLGCQVAARPGERDGDFFLTGTRLYVLLSAQQIQLCQHAVQSQLGCAVLRMSPRAACQVLHGQILHLIWHKSDGGESDKGLSLLVSLFCFFEGSQDSSCEISYLCSISCEVWITLESCVAPYRG